MSTMRFMSLGAVALALSVAPALAAGGSEHAIERQEWSFSGFRGQFDSAQLQRGFQIYKDVCVSCHGLRRVRFRNLAEPGGPEFPEDAVKALAAEWPNQITDGPNDDGEMFERPARLADPILGPYKNDKQAMAANGGALPPDLSLIAKARNPEYTGPFWLHPTHMLADIAKAYQEGGADYIFALLTGYAEKVPPYKRDENGRLHRVSEGEAGGAVVERCVTIVPGENGAVDICNPKQETLHYNTAFPGGQLAMMPPLSKDAPFQYQDGTGSLDQNARDIAAFLSWAADPALNDRKRIGWQVMLYLLVTTVLLYLGKKRIWSRIEH